MTVEQRVSILCQCDPFVELRAKNNAARLWALTYPDRRPFHSIDEAAQMEWTLLTLNAELIFR